MKPKIPQTFTQWILISEGEGHFDFPSRKAAFEEAARQARETPTLVLSIYRLHTLVMAPNGKAVRLFDADGVPK